MATNPFACEGWFRVELVPALINMGVEGKRISPDYGYPNTRSKADLAIIASDKSRTDVVFELKHFVQFADAQKKKSWPTQVQRLTHLVEQGVVDQGVAFMIFGYLDSSQPGKLISSFFDKASNWRVVGPKPLLTYSPVVIAVATL